MNTYKIVGTKEGSEEVVLAIPARNIQEALQIVEAHLANGGTSVKIVDEDRDIRDGRRAAGLDPDVEIEGPPGCRRVKST